MTIPLWQAIAAVLVAGIAGLFLAAAVFDAYEARRRRAFGPYRRRFEDDPL